MRVLITGVAGFAGSHLADYLVSLGGIDVHGLDLADASAPRGTFHPCDLRDAAAVRRVLAESRPDRIFHLAAQASVPASVTAPAETLMTNLLGTLNLLEAVRQAGIIPRIHVAGSSDEYGQVLPQELPVAETNPLRPLNPYAVSKVGQGFLAYQYAMSHRLHVVRTRAFNHTGPRRGEQFAESSFAKQIAEIEAGRQEPVVRVGNLQAARDFTDVRDVVRAYWLAVEHGEPGEVYNICSGEARGIGEVLQALLRLSSATIRIEPDPARLRPADTLLIRGDNRKFVQRTRWRPQIPFATTLRDLLTYWRERTAAHVQRI